MLQLSRLLYILCILLSLPPELIESQIKFETERLGMTYESLPVSTQKMILPAEPLIDRTISDKGISQNAMLRVRYNQLNEISHLGLQLTVDSGSKKYKNEIDFVENLLLNITTSRTVKFAVFDLMKDNNIRWSLNDRLLSALSLEQWKKLADNVLQSRAVVNYDDSGFRFVWSVAGNTIKLKFRADINLVRGMNKSELEAEFLKKLNENIRIKSLNVTKQNALPVSDGLYVVRGQKFVSDEFHSDIYLIKNDSRAYVPVFDSAYFAESFSNLFIINFYHDIFMNTTLVLFKSKVDKQLKVNKVNTLLMQDCRAFIGLSSVAPEKIQATIFYYNPVYGYVHMLVVQTTKKEFFNCDNGTIKGDLYLYIPRSDLRKNIKADLIPTQEDKL